MSLDTRRHAYRPDLADARLAGSVDAARFVEGDLYRVVAPLAPFRSKPDLAAGVTATKLRGETIRVFERRDGWAWGQSETDGYVGWTPLEKLVAGAYDAVGSVIVSAPRAPIYAEPSARAQTIDWTPMAGLLTVDPAGRAEAGFLRLGGDLAGGWAAARHVRPIDDAPLEDWVAAAESLLGSPYVWGGDSADGVDCSGLISVSRRSVGLSAPRDSDMQEAELGINVSADAPLLRGDLIFWRGHVGVMLDARMLLHANAHAMMVVSEPLETAMARIAASEYGEATARKRV